MFRITITRPAAPARLRTSVAVKRPRPARDRGMGKPASATLRVPDPRVEPPIQEIDREGRADEDESGHEDGGLDERVVALEDGGHREAAHARPGKNGLRDDSAAQQGAQLETNDRH